MACLALSAAVIPAFGQDDRPLTSAQHRMLDGAHLYLSASEYCRDAPAPEPVRAEILAKIDENGISRESAARYLAANRDRLRAFAETAFNGRRGQALCASIREQFGTK